MNRILLRKEGQNYLRTFAVIIYSLVQAGRRGRRYTSITLGYDAGRLFTPERQPAKKSKTDVTSSSSGALPSDQEPPTKKYVVNKKRTSRRLK